MSLISHNNRILGPRPQAHHADGDEIYYNATIRNTDPLDVIRAQYNDNRVVPILNKPDDYMVAVVRFTVPVGALPLFEWNSFPAAVVAFAE